MAQAAKVRDLNGSPVMRSNMRVVSALKRRCRHDELEINCYACRRAQPYEMGRLSYLKATGEVVEPAYLDWGKTVRVQDLLETDGLRASTKIRWIVGEMFPEIKLDDVIIDFHAGTQPETIIWRGAAGKQLWIRLPKQTNREAFDYNEWVFAIESVSGLIKSGLNGEWKRKKTIKPEEL